MGGDPALVGIALFGLGALATGAGFVILFRLQRPGTDAAARKVLVAAGVLGAFALALFAWAAAGGRLGSVEEDASRRSSRDTLGR